MFTQEVRNGFEMIARTAACELPAKREGYRHFIGVYPPRRDKGVSQWRVQRFEVPASLIEGYFGEEDLVDSESVKLETLEQVEALLSAWGIDSAQFRAPLRSDYPL